MHVYIAGPYTNPDPVSNANRAIKVGTALMELGHVPFVPHLNLLWDLVDPGIEYDSWLAWDLSWLSRCDAMLRLPGDSPGADLEEAFCQENGIPVYHSIEALNAAAKK